MLWWQAHRCLCAVRSTGPTAASHRMCNDTDHTALNCCRSRERLSRVACASNHQRMSTYHDSAAKTPGTSVIQMRTNVGHCSLRLRWLKQRPRGLRSLPTVTQHFAFFLFFQFRKVCVIRYLPLWRFLAPDSHSEEQRLDYPTVNQSNGCSCKPTMKHHKQMASRHHTPAPPPNTSPLVRDCKLLRIHFTCLPLI